MEVVAFRAMHETAISFYQPINLKAVFLGDAEDFFVLITAI